MEEKIQINIKEYEKIYSKIIEIIGLYYIEIDEIRKTKKEDKLNIAKDWLEFFDKNEKLKENNLTKNTNFFKTVLNVLGLMIKNFKNNFNYSEQINKLLDIITIYPNEILIILNEIIILNKMKLEKTVKKNILLKIIHLLNYQHELEDLNSFSFYLLKDLKDDEEIILTILEICKKMITKTFIKLDEKTIQKIKNLISFLFVIIKDENGTLITSENVLENILKLLIKIKNNEKNLSIFDNNIMFKNDECIENLKEKVDPNIFFSMYNKIQSDILAYKNERKRKQKEETILNPEKTASMKILKNKKKKIDKKNKILKKKGIKNKKIKLLE